MPLGQLPLAWVHPSPLATTDVLTNHGRMADTLRTPKGQKQPRAAGLVLAKAQLKMACQIHPMWWAIFGLVQARA